MVKHMILLSAFATVVGILCGVAATHACLRKGCEDSRQRLAAALVLVPAGWIGLLWCFLLPPPFSVKIDGPPSSLRNDPAGSIYFGNGCFWHTQYDFVVVEQDPDGPFRRNDSAVTSLIGYAGGRYESPSGAVCYHGLPHTDYSRLGHAEACSIQLDDVRGGRAQSQVAALAQTYFEHGFQTLSDGRRQRLDPQDRGAEYWNVIGLPGGMDNQELWPIIEAANTHGMRLQRGAIGDSEGEFVVYVYDSVEYPFFRGEEYHQFHPNNVIQRDLPASYLVTKKVQEDLGRIDESDRGCFALEFGGLVAVLAFVCAAIFSCGSMFLYSVLAPHTKAARCCARRGSHADVPSSMES
mmetsp:Transcript_77105/g.156975  ORF Transcript_77105/g.156975 Transcript_77105/m.156975 type:complete len:352 (+) Transcript_77105:34-1089(+)